MCLYVNCFTSLFEDQALCRVPCRQRDIHRDTRKDNETICLRLFENIEISKVDTRKDNETIYENIEITKVVGYNFCFI